MRTDKPKILLTIVTMIMLLVSSSVILGVTPDPGHPANEIGAGVFGEVGNYIFPSGSKVGIGDTNPENELDVDDGLGINGQSEVAFNERAIFGYDGTRAAAMIRGVSGKAIVFDTNDTNERMRITSGGNVGIGIVSPSAFLHLVGQNAPETTGADAITVLKVEGGDGGSAALTFGNYGGDGSSIILTAGDGGDAWGGGDGGDITLTPGQGGVGTKDGDDGVIFLDGKVGVNTNNPSVNLDVKGDVRITPLAANSGPLMYAEGGSLIVQLGLN